MEPENRTAHTRRFGKTLPSLALALAGVCLLAPSPA